ncbi:MULTISPECIES: hypothetical protein [Streptomyces]|uniref:hypothetical protein n=1 Tax=Streptomyces TaxID=1883 RepID=UPI0003183D6D|nr:MULTISPECIES: hypothetical protein [unclassified Streptomyces]MBQ0882588.1 hypothetical protein [Streptomyces sp. RT42]MDI3099567.1 hypothetical protein [Streptomyces sp. AN-3]
MYGNGAAGPPPPRGATTVITLRVLFAAAGFLTCGLLSCIPLFRVAVLRGGRLDWTLAWLSLPVSIGCLAVVGSLPETDGRTDAAMAALLLIGAAAAAHFLVVDLRLHAARPPFPGYQPYPAPGPHYAQTQPAVGPYGPALAPQTPPPHGPGPAPAGYRTPPQTPPPRPAAPRPPVAGTPVPQPPGPARMPQPPAPARIDQVRAELDELSDYLRRHDGGGSANGSGEGGR